MTDKEMLEYAAKAAGYWVCEPLRYGEFRVCLPEQHHLSFAWNPLTDDGDALRLAVKLGIWIQIGKHFVSVNAPGGVIIEEKCGSDPNAATRRAITRAAAEVGRKL